MFDFFSYFIVYAHISFSVTMKIKYPRIQRRHAVCGFSLGIAVFRIPNVLQFIISNLTCTLYSMTAEWFSLQCTLYLFCFVLLNPSLQATSYETFWTIVFALWKWKVRNGERSKIKKRFRAQVIYMVVRSCWATAKQRPRWRYTIITQYRYHIWKSVSYINIKWNISERY